MTIELAERVERAARPDRENVGRDVAEVVGREARGERQPDVRRRRAMGDAARRIFLEVVGRQPVFLGDDERLEESPRAPRERAFRSALDEELQRMRLFLGLAD